MTTLLGRIADGTVQGPPARASGSGWLYLRTYQKLAAAGIEEKKFVFKMRPKTHYFAHLCLHVAATRENPRTYDLMSAEDYMGRLKQIGLRADKRCVCDTIVERLCIFWSHRWYRHAHPWGDVVLEEMMGRA